MNDRRLNHISFVLLAVLLLAGCRGTQSSDPPVHLNRNMDFQSRYDPQTRNTFFDDNRSMRTPVPGTVARGMLREDERFYAGRNTDGSFLEEIPVPTTRELLLRGQRRYDIFCAVCHGRAGDGQGIIMTGGYGFTPAPTFHSDRLRDIQDGYLYDVIARGIRTMPAYGQQVPVADRWAIVAYIRALQRSQYADEADVPPSIRAQIQQQAVGTGAGAGQAGDAGAQGDTLADPDASAPADTQGAAGAQNDASGNGAAEQPGGGNQ